MNLQAYILKAIGLIDSFVLPLLLAIALVVFLWNAFRYFIVGGDNEESKEKAKSLALWGILAFIIIASIWGLVRIGSDVLGLTRPTPITPDYMGGTNSGSFSQDLQGMNQNTLNNSISDWWNKNSPSYDNYSGAGTESGIPPADSTQN